MTIDTGTSVTIARPDLTAGLPETDLNTPQVLQMASGEILSILKETLMELTQGWRPMTWVFVASINY
jgi:hypothetical protein